MAPAGDRSGHVRDSGWSRDRGQTDGGTSDRTSAAHPAGWHRGSGRQDYGGGGSHPDFFIFQSLPGAGAALAPPLLAALGSQRDRYASAEEVQKYSGIAPVTERSGEKKWVHFRWACPKFLRQSFHEWAGHSTAQSVWARAYYQQQRQRGKDHHAAVRALAFKWIRIVFRCWQERAAYDENRYLAALAKRGSPLTSVVAAAAISM